MYQLHGTTVGLYMIVRHIAGRTYISYSRNNTEQSNMHVQIVILPADLEYTPCLCIVFLVCVDYVCVLLFWYNSESYISSVIVFCTNLFACMNIIPDRTVTGLLLHLFLSY